MRSEDVVARARALVGTRFRPQGRDARFGLDCAGVVIAAFALEARGFRRDYRLRGAHVDEVRRLLSDDFRRIAPHRSRSGDILLLASAKDQVHMAIRTDLGLVHADAGLGQVVERPGEPDWPILGVYRRRTHIRRSK